MGIGISAFITVFLKSIVPMGLAGHLLYHCLFLLGNYILFGLSAPTGQQAVSLRRQRSSGSPHRARMAQGQSSKGPLRPGQRPGYICTQHIRPERAKAYRNQMLLPFQGEHFPVLYTQGVALG